MKKALNKTFIALTLIVGLAFLMGSCGPTYVRTNRPVVYRPVAPARVVVAPVPVVVVRKYTPPPRPNRTVVKVRF
jgi:hypothetical protein